MTVIVSVKINDGIVMACDSAMSFGIGQIYHNAEKIVNLVKGLPIGIMIAGDGNIANESITTLLKDLRRRLSGDSSDHSDWKIDKSSYKMVDVAEKVRQFLYDEKMAGGKSEVWTQLRLCGYSASRPLAELWEIKLLGNQCPAPLQVQSEDQFGIRWDGYYEALDRLIGGLSGKGLKVIGDVTKTSLDDESIQEIHGNLYEHLAIPAMPIQDAIDLVRFLVETTIGFQRFAVRVQPKTVGGPIEIASITKHEGFRWVQRKHFYPKELNV